MPHIRRLAYPLKHYLRVVTIREVIFVWIMPAIIVAIIGIVIRDGAQVSLPSLQGLLSYVVTLMAILIGFTITCVTILTTSNAPNVNDIRTIRDSRTPRNGSTLSIYQWVLTQFTVLLLFEFFCLSGNLLYEFLLAGNKFIRIGGWFLIFDGYVVLVIIVMNAVNIAQFYQVFWKDNIEE